LHNWTVQESLLICLAGATSKLDGCCGPDSAYLRGLNFYVSLTLEKVLACILTLLRKC